MSTKFYAVKKGKTTGIFTNWADCQSQISGFSGAEYKSFISEEEAKAYLFDIDLWDEIIKEDISKGYTVIFTDGSYIDGIEKYGYGVVIIKDLNNIEKLCGAHDNPKFLPSRNIAGEVFGAINAMDWAVSNEISKIKLYYDYEGIGKWLSEWDTNTPISKTYLSVYEKYKDILDIDFIHVKGHSNCKYNDMADNLAKSAIQERKYIKVSGDNWFKIESVSINDLEAVLDLLKDESVKIQTNNISNGLRHELKLGQYNLHLTHFNNGTILVQGKQSSLFQLTISIMGELLDFEMTEIMSNAYRISVDKDKVESDFTDLFKNIPTDYPKEFVILIKQSIINLTYYHETVYDYSFFAVPALRALEGHIKYMIQKFSSYHVSKTFDCFNKNPSQTSYCLSISISDRNRKKQIEDCYNYYKNERDRIDHAGDILGKTSNTYIISKKDIVDEIIKKSLSLINSQLLTIN